MESPWQIVLSFPKLIVGSGLTVIRMESVMVQALLSVTVSMYNSEDKGLTVMELELLPVFQLYV